MWWLALSASLAAEPSAEPSVFARKYLVIVGTEKAPADFGALTVRLGALSDPKVEPFRLTSTDFTGLRPCWELLVARAFPGKNEAVAYSERLKAQGVESYVRATGNYVGDAPDRSAACTEQDGQTWMIAGGGLLLGQDFEPDPEERHRKLVVDELEGVKVGDRVRVMPANQVCTVRGFSSLDRSVDGGFGRCGYPDLVAELDESCPSGTFAVRDGAPVPVVYTKASLEPKGLARLKKVFTSSAAYQQVRGRMASEEGFSETFEPQAWTGPGGTAVYFQADFSVPVEDGDCGMPGEETARVSQAWLLRPGKEMLPLETPNDEFSTVTGYVDLDVDSIPEPMVEGSQLRHLWGTVHPDSVMFCGCPC